MLSRRTKHRRNLGGRAVQCLCDRQFHFRACVGIVEISTLGQNPLTAETAPASRRPVARSRFAFTGSNSGVERARGRTFAGADRGAPTEDRATLAFAPAEDGGIS